MAYKVRSCLVLWVLLASCDGDDSGPALPDPGPDSGLDPSQAMIDLTEEEVGTLCDWGAGRFGGYNRGRTCSDGSYLGSQKSRQACVNDWKNAPASCTATVGKIEDCINGTVKATTCTGVDFNCFELLFCALKIPT
jgi:hypothetical protein